MPQCLGQSFLSYHGAQTTVSTSSISSWPWFACELPRRDPRSTGRTVCRPIVRELGRQRTVLLRCQRPPTRGRWHLTVARDSLVPGTWAHSKGKEKPKFWTSDYFSQAFGAMLPEGLVFFFGPRKQGKVRKSSSCHVETLRLERSGLWPRGPFP